MAKMRRIDEDGIAGFLEKPGGEPAFALVLTHGAGGDCAAPLLVAVAEALRAAGAVTLRCNLPFRQKRPKGPPSPAGAAADRAGLATAAAWLKRHASGTKLLLGGTSYGGRQASMLAAERPEVADALLLLSYPLHPPGKPDRLRTEHLPALHVPTVVVQGATDPFGTPAELRPAFAAAAGPVTLLEVAGAGHELKRGAFDRAPLVAACRAALGL